MSNELIAALVGAVVGAIIARFIAWIVDFLREKRITENRIKLFTIAIIDNLQASLPLVKRIEEQWSQTGQVWLDCTIELKEQRKIYQKYYENVLLYPEDVRKLIFDYYIKTDKLILLLESFQNRMFALINQYSNVVKIVRESDPNLSPEDVEKRALSLLNSENQEATAIREAVKNTINQLSVDFRIVVA